LRECKAQMSENNLYPEPPKELGNLNFKNIIKFVGPGIIIASVTIGSGELSWGSRGGAVFGYSMMWCFLIAGLFKGVQVYASNRHIVLTGEHPMASWTMLPGPKNWMPLLLVIPPIFIMPLAFSGLPELLAGYLNYLTDTPITGDPVWNYTQEEFMTNVWGTVVILVCVGLAMFSSTDLVEKVSTWVLGILLICIVYSVIKAGPDIMEALEGLFVPSIQEYPRWMGNDTKYFDFFKRGPWIEISLYLSAVGGGTQDYIGYIGLLRQKKWGLAGVKNASKEEMERASENPEELRRAKIWGRAPLLDTTISFALVIIVTLLFVLLGAELLTENVPMGGNLLTVQENFISVLHPDLKYIYRLGALLAMIGTMYGAFVIYRNTFAEGIIAIFKNKVPNIASKKWRVVVYSYCFFSGVALMWVPKDIAGDVTGKLVLASIVSGATSCGIWCFAMIWVDKIRLPAKLQMGLKLKVCLWVAGLVLTGLGLKSMVSYFTPQTKYDVYVVSFNVNGDSPQKSWADRKDSIVKTLKYGNPGVFGLQEISPSQVREIIKATTYKIKENTYTYTKVGEGSNIILFRPDRYTLESEGSFDLPQTTQRCNWARLVKEDSKSAFYVFNTQLDRDFQNSRDKSVAVIMEQIKKRKHPESPYILTGNFGVDEDNSAIKFLNEQKLISSFRALYPNDENAGTFHDFKGGTQGSKQDFIFVEDTTQVMMSYPDRAKEDYPSDHYPMVSIIQFDIIK